MLKKDLINKINILESDNIKLQEKISQRDTTIKELKKYMSKLFDNHHNVYISFINKKLDDLIIKEDN